jgi:hypothetical protein
VPGEVDVEHDDAGDELRAERGERERLAREARLADQFAFSTMLRDADWSEPAKKTQTSSPQSRKSG